MKSLLLIFFCFSLINIHIQGKGELIFNEIMYDPSPEIGLPAYEYIELYNRSGDTVCLREWTLQAGNRTLILTDYTIFPRTYLLLCYRDTEMLYGEAEQVIDILSSRTMLLNEGTVLLLYDEDSVLVDWMEYSPALHTGDYFEEGGWSLERIDPDRTCHSPDNWTTSTSWMGGTPGKMNSVFGKNPDRDPPSPVSVYISDSPSGNNENPQNLILEFNESLDRNSVPSSNAWIVDGGIGTPDSITLIHPFNRVFKLFYLNGFSPGRKYTLGIPPGIKDCSGNQVELGANIFFALPVKPDKSDILISEILFNPMPYCPDFIEVYNPGSKTFDLADLRLANREKQIGEIHSAGKLISGHRLFFPEEYLVLTSEPESLSGFYLIHDPRTLVKVNDMPAMGDIEGSVVLLDKYLGVIDEIDYHRDMHHPLLASREGVSLERITFETGSGNLSNWHSAASIEGYATPGRQNSQFRQAEVIDEGIQVEPEIFSPDMDGIDDILMISYRFRSPGLIASILIFDPRGRLVREIAEGDLLGTEGFYTWDGCDRQGRRAGTGLYLVLSEVSGLDKQIRKFRKTCVLSRGRNP